MIDAIYEGFLRAQEREGERLARESEIVSIDPLEPGPCTRYLLRFDARGVVAGPSGPRTTRGAFGVGVWFPGDYLWRVNAPRVLTWLGPENMFHPNVNGPFICLGTIRPGTPLVEICFRVYAVIGYQSYGLANPLNHAAAAWARRNLERFPIDPRPLKRRVTGSESPMTEKGDSP